MSDDNHIAEITFDDFTKVNMRAGTILKAEQNPKARVPAFILDIDFGDFGIKKSSAQITEHYTPEDLVGQQVIAVTNFPSKRVAGVKSEVLVLACMCGESGTVLLRPTQAVSNGSQVA